LSPYSLESHGFLRRKNKVSVTASSDIWTGSLVIRRTEFIWALTALAGVVLLGTLQGILVAIVVSLVALAHQTADPPVRELGRKPGTDVFRPRSKEHPEDETFPDLLMIQLEGRVFFANAEQVRVGWIVNRARRCHGNSTKRQQAFRTPVPTKCANGLAVANRLAPSSEQANFGSADIVSLIGRCLTPETGEVFYRHNYCRAFLRCRRTLRIFHPWCAEISSEANLLARDLPLTKQDHRRLREF
jgi:hypothetical protein